MLLIEGDIRRRTFSKYFDISEMRGILSVISKDEPLKEVAHHDARMGVDVLIGEKTSTNAADVFSSEKFVSFIKEARAQYDYVVIDTPPVLVVPDARVISKIADAVLFVVKWDSTPRSQVLHSLRMFEQVGTQVSGLVLSQMDPKGMKRYGYIYGAHYATGYYDN